MDILPQIPSDNLYKFFCFSGLFLLLFSIVYPDLMEQEYLSDFTKNQAVFEKRIDSLIAMKNANYIHPADSLDNPVLKKLDDYLKTEILANADDENYREKQTFLERFHPELADNAVGRRIARTYNNYDNIVKTPNPATMIKIEQKSVDKILDYKEKRLERLKTFQIYGLLFGAILLVVGIYNWYHKIQKLNDKKLLKESQL